MRSKQKASPTKSPCAFIRALNRQRLEPSQLLHRTGHQIAGVLQHAVGGGHREQGELRAGGLRAPGAFVDQGLAHGPAGLEKAVVQRRQEPQRLHHRSDIPRVPAVLEDQHGALAFQGLDRSLEHGRLMAFGIDLHEVDPGKTKPV